MHPNSPLDHDDARLLQLLAQKLEDNGYFTTEDRATLPGQIRDILRKVNGEALCVDEGCDHHGTPHVCKSPAPSNYALIELVGAADSAKELLQSIENDRKARWHVASTIDRLQKAIDEPTLKVFKSD